MSWPTWSVLRLCGDGDGGIRDKVSIVRSESDGAAGDRGSVRPLDVSHVSSNSTGDSTSSIKLCSVWVDSRRLRCWLEILRVSVSCDGRRRRRRSSPVSA